MKVPRVSGWYLRVAMVAVEILVGTAVLRAQAYEVVHNFCRDWQICGEGPIAGYGYSPRSSMMVASNGLFYGTTLLGRTYDAGSVFRFGDVGPFGILFWYPLHDFDGLDGYEPSGRLLESGGYLYGTTIWGRYGSVFASGSVYRTDFLGNTKVLHEFTNGEYPVAGLIEAGGYFFGTTPGGGAFGHGTVFRMDSSGTLTTLHSFSGPDGDTPRGELLLGSDGYFYGTTTLGGVGLGTLFRMGAFGNVSTLHTFSGATDGANPSGPLLEVAGLLYGTSAAGGQFGYGSVFSVDFFDSFTLLHSFAGAPNDGAVPETGLVRMGSDFYGTTSRGGTDDEGTLFRMMTPGVTTVLHDFGGANDGRNPRGLTVRESLYGITENGGPWQDEGIIYRQAVRAAIHKLLPKKAGPVFVPPGIPVQLKGKLFAVGGGAPSVTFGGLPATNVVVEDPETINVLTPVDLSPGTLNDVTVTEEDGTTATLARAWLGDFLDVLTEDPNHDFVERVFRASVMEGCGDGNFCQAGKVDRGAFAAMALKAKHGPAWVPPACTGQFHDVRCPGPEADWVEAAVSEGIAEACARNRFCPNQKLRRETMPELVLKTEHGADYMPPPCTGIFRDVRCGSKFADAIEQLYGEGVVEACSTDPMRYCPNRDVDRVSMARYSVKAFRLP